jgi:hypothetical protein
MAGLGVLSSQPVCSGIVIFLSYLGILSPRGQPQYGACTDFLIFR